MKKNKLIKWKVIRVWEVEAETAQKALMLSKKKPHTRAMVQERYR